MSALPPKADMCGALANVRFGPKADIGLLFDYFVRRTQKAGWNIEAERFGSL